MPNIERQTGFLELNKLIDMTERMTEMRAVKGLKQSITTLLLLAFCMALLLPDAAQAQSGMTQDAGGNTNNAAATSIAATYKLRFKNAANFMDADVVTDKKSQGPGMVNHATSGPVQMWPVMIPTAMSSVPTMRDTAIQKNMLQTFGYPVSDTQFQMIERMDHNIMVENLYNPEKAMWMATTMGGIATNSAANSMASFAINQAYSAIDFCSEFLANFTAEPGNVWQTIRDRLFIPMAILLLLPGAVLAQVRAIVAQGSPVLIGQEVHPLEGILRSIVAVFLIPASFLVINYGIDVANSITFTISDEYHKIFHRNMYEDAKCAIRRAFPVADPKDRRNAISQKENPTYKGNTAFASFEGKTLITTLDDPCAGIHEVRVLDEDVLQSKNVNRMLMNGVNDTTCLTWNISCAFQMAFLYYLWCMGPIAAALWVWPIAPLRGALASWIEGVITVCFWSLFWNTVILLMACFRGVGDSGTMIMSALISLAVLSVKSAFDFTGLASAAVGEAQRMAQQAAQNAKGGGKGGQSGGHGQQGGSHGQSHGGNHGGQVGSHQNQHAAVGAGQSGGQSSGAIGAAQPASASFGASGLNSSASHGKNDAAKPNESGLTGHGAKADGAGAAAGANDHGGITPPPGAHAGPHGGADGAKHGHGKGDAHTPPPLGGAQGGDNSAAIGAIGGAAGMAQVAVSGNISNTGNISGTLNHAGGAGGIGGGHGGAHGAGQNNAGGLNGPNGGNDVNALAGGTQNLNNFNGAFSADGSAVAGKNLHVGANGELLDQNNKPVFDANHNQLTAANVPGANGAVGVTGASVPPGSVDQSANSFLKQDANGNISLDSSKVGDIPQLSGNLANDPAAVAAQKTAVDTMAMNGITTDQLSRAVANPNGAEYSSIANAVGVAPPVLDAALHGNASAGAMTAVGFGGSATAQTFASMGNDTATMATAAFQNAQSIQSQVGDPNLISNATMGMNAQAGAQLFNSPALDQQFAQTVSNYSQYGAAGDSMVPSVSGYGTTAVASGDLSRMVGNDLSPVGGYASSQGFSGPAVASNDPGAVAAHNAASDIMAMTGTSQAQLTQALQDPGGQAYQQLQQSFGASPALMDAALHGNASAAAIVETGFGNTATAHQLASQSVTAAQSVQMYDNAVHSAPNGAQLVQDAAMGMNVQAGQQLLNSPQLDQQFASTVNAYSGAQNYASVDASYSASTLAMAQGQVVSAQSVGDASVYSGYSGAQVAGGNPVVGSDFSGQVASAQSYGGQSYDASSIGSYAMSHGGSMPALNTSDPGAVAASRGAADIMAMTGTSQAQLTQALQDPGGQAYQQLQQTFGASPALMDAALHGNASAAAIVETGFGSTATAHQLASQSATAAQSVQMYDAAVHSAPNGAQLVQEAAMGMNVQAGQQLLNSPQLDQQFASTVNAYSSAQNYASVDASYSSSTLAMAQGQSVGVQSIGDGSAAGYGGGYGGSVGQTYVDSSGQTHFAAVGQSYVDASGQTHIAAAAGQAYVDSSGQTHFAAAGQSYVDASGQTHVATGVGQTYVDSSGQTHFAAAGQSYVDASGQTHIATAAGQTYVDSSGQTQFASAGQTYVDAGGVSHVAQGSVDSSSIGGYAASQGFNGPAPASNDPVAVTAHNAAADIMAMTGTSQAQLSQALQDPGGQAYQQLTQTFGASPALMDAALHGNASAAAIVETGFGNTATAHQFAGQSATASQAVEMYNHAVHAAPNGAELVQQAAVNMNAQAGAQLLSSPQLDQQFASTVNAYSSAQNYAAVDASYSAQTLSMGQGQSVGVQAIADGSGVGSYAMSQGYSAPQLASYDAGSVSAQRGAADIMAMTHTSPAELHQALAHPGSQQYHELEQRFGASPALVDAALHGNVAAAAVVETAFGHTPTAHQFAEQSATAAQAVQMYDSAAQMQGGPQLVQQAAMSMDPQAGAAILASSGLDNQFAATVNAYQAEYRNTGGYVEAPAVPNYTTGFADNGGGTAAVSPQMIASTNVDAGYASAGTVGSGVDYTPSAVFSDPLTGWSSGSVSYGDPGSVAPSGSYAAADPNIAAASSQQSSYDYYRTDNPNLTHQVDWNAQAQQAVQQAAQQAMQQYQGQSQPAPQIAEQPSPAQFNDAPAPVQPVMADAQPYVDAGSNSYGGYQTAAADYRAPEIVPPISSDYVDNASHAQNSANFGSGPAGSAPAPVNSAPAPRPEGSRTFNQIPFFAAMNNGKNNQARAAEPAAKPQGEVKQANAQEGPKPQHQDTSLTPKGPKGRGKTQAELDEEQRRLLEEYKQQFGSDSEIV